MHSLTKPQTLPRRRRTVAVSAAVAALSAALVAGSVAPADATPAKAESPAASARTGYVHVRVVTKTVERQKFSAPVIERKDSSMNVGQEKLVRHGRPGVQDVTYRFRLENGHVVKRTIVDRDVRRQPRAKIVRVGTHETFGVW